MRERLPCVSHEPLPIRLRISAGAFSNFIHWRNLGDFRLSILDAAHIRAFAAGGEHVPSNGLRPRTDIHGLSRRADSYPAEPLVSFQINRQPSGWNLPTRAFEAHSHRRRKVQAAAFATRQGRAPAARRSSGHGRANSQPFDGGSIPADSSSTPRPMHAHFLVALGKPYGRLPKSFDHQLKKSRTTSSLTLFGSPFRCIPVLHKIRRLKSQDCITTLR